MQNISISFLKGVNFIGIIILLKWFDKRWASFYLPLFVFSEAFDILYMKIGNFLFAEKFAQVNDFLIYVSIALTFLMLFVMYYYLPTDPLDYNLIINESAYYLSTRYSENPK
jgi:archaellum biogenesis protein FlaJ (TadC family)